MIFSKKNHISEKFKDVNNQFYMQKHIKKCYNYHMMKRIKEVLLTICLFMPCILSALEIDGLYSKNVIVYNKDENKII